MPINAKELLKKATNVSTLTQGSTISGSAKMSFSVVYNRNGKRLTISKKLAEILGLEATAQLTIVDTDGVIILGKLTSEDPDKRIELILKDEFDKIKDAPTGKKIAYHAEAAYSIVSAFGLDYHACASKSFDRISIDNSDPNNPLAIITIK